MIYGFFCIRFRELIYNITTLAKRFQRRRGRNRKGLEVIKVQGDFGVIDIIDMIDISILSSRLRVLLQELGLAFLRSIETRAF
jgi:hypothetical protein